MGQVDQHLHGAGGRAGRGRELGGDPFQVATVHGRRDRACRGVGDGRGGQQRPAAAGQGRSTPWRRGRVAPRRPAWPSRRAGPRPARPPPRASAAHGPAWSSAHRPGVPGVMRPPGATATSSLTTTPAPTGRRGQAPGGRRGQPAVVGVVLGADGQGDPVGQGHRPLASGANSGGGARAARAGRRRSGRRWPRTRVAPGRSRWPIRPERVSRLQANWTGSKPS